MRNTKNKIALQRFLVTKGRLNMAGHFTLLWSYSAFWEFRLFHRRYALYAAVAVIFVGYRLLLDVVDEFHATTLERSARCDVFVAFGCTNIELTRCFILIHHYAHAVVLRHRLQECFHRLCHHRESEVSQCWASESNILDGASTADYRIFREMVIYRNQTKSAENSECSENSENSSFARWRSLDHFAIVSWLATFVRECHLAPESRVAAAWLSPQEAHQLDV